MSITFKSRQEADAWVERHAEYIWYVESRLKSGWGVVSTRRELIRKRGPARIVGLDYRGIAIVAATLDHRAHVPSGFQERMARFG